MMFPSTTPIPSNYLRKGKGNPSFQSSSALEQYLETYKTSIRDPDSFWDKTAKVLLEWDKTFETIRQGSFEGEDNAWFVEGRLNASFNCVDRWAREKPNYPAIIYEPDEPNSPLKRTISFIELRQEVSRAAWVLKDLGVRKGDTVAIYMPMIPEAFVALLACSRIGAIHSVVFAGFSATALRDRIRDAKAEVVVTADKGFRGGKCIDLKKITDEAIEGCPQVRHCLFVRRSEDSGHLVSRDRVWQEECAKWSPYFPPESMNSEDPLFMLYTSGSTGKPKGLLHSTAGYLLGAALTTKHIFDIQDGDVFFCGGDIGWITGHTYGIYGPLSLGCTTVIYEGTPVYPNPSRYWDIITKHRVTQFYSAPTALRLLKRAGDEFVNRDMTAHLRVLGSVGEPLAANIWKWLHDVVGGGKAQVVDTFFQTETGSHVLSALAGVVPSKPGCCCLPFLGVEAAILDPITGKELPDGAEGVLVIRKPTPSMCRTIWGDHARLAPVYYKPYPGYYFTGDKAIRDHDGYYWIRGRTDDVINVSAHRLSTAEIEGALLEHPLFAEVAVIGVPDDLTGQAVAAFLSTKPSNGPTDFSKEAIVKVQQSIGKFAVPAHVIVVDDLPRTRSGKIMRRLLRKIWEGEEESLGDTSTLVNPSCIDSLIATVRIGH
ncbi:acetyl-coenzyme A synthetase [Corynespora cassiicola Philippines]|uniref:Acetyl-coenzyme A synthetase n=1 Tax=Corynespora cassiicola Philippines TaxID=1448308 RepID=A0A2T2N564_CORCC|nr:acetyl-coenzyme A synthetase [Corynespora cassiicola Philippines]